MVQTSCQGRPWANPGQEPRCVQGQSVPRANKEGLFPTLLRLTAPSCLVWAEEQECCPHGGQGERELAKGHHVRLCWALEVPTSPPPTLRGMKQVTWPSPTQTREPHLHRRAQSAPRPQAEGGCLPFLRLRKKTPHASNTTSPFSHGVEPSTSPPVSLG